MFRKASSFCLLITTLIICIFYATNDTFAQTISAYDLGVNASQVTHVRVKRATYNTFIISHTLDPDPGNKNFFAIFKTYLFYYSFIGNTPNYPFTTQGQWNNWYHQQEDRYLRAGGNPMKPLTLKSFNTIAITAPDPIRDDFKMATEDVSSLSSFF